MKKIVLFAICFCIFAVNGQDREGTRQLEKYWHISGDNEISFNISDSSKLPYSDNIEMAGKRVAGIVSYALDEDRNVSIEREVFFPQMHQFKTEESSWFFDYRAYLQENYTDAILPKLYVNQMQFVPGQVEQISINGKLTIQHASSKNGLQLTRTFFPSVNERLFVEQWEVTNTKPEAVTLTSGNTKLQYLDYGARGKFTREISSDAPEKIALEPGERLTFSIRIMAKMEHEDFPGEDGTREKEKRDAFIKIMASSLKLETPDSIINTLFEFSKIRASESIFESELGLIHSPGGGRYYAGIWANDQAEYVNPFFPYLGYDIGNTSAMNTFRAFASKTNANYDKIQYAFEIEGLVKPFLLDRGDAAMIAYGASHYALARGDEKEAQELWPLIEWCLEYCKRQLNEEGVVQSESDEMEGRIETGNANLSTSCLYYGALNNAVHLSHALDMNKALRKQYIIRARELNASIENYFGAHVEGLETYKYYKEHTKLRHWICMPLAVGIHERKEATTTALFDSLWTDNGVLVEKNSNNKKIRNIFWDRGTLYALRGTFMAGKTEQSLQKLQAFSQKRLLGNRVPYVVEASPEGNMAHLSAESALYCRVIIEGMFGIKPNGFRSFTLTPRLPNEWDRMKLKHVKAFGQNFHIEVKRINSKIQVEVWNKNKHVLSKTIKEGANLDVSL